MLRYSYYTAGSGGAGPTILETSFLLAGEECTVYKDGQPYKLPPISNRRDVDFGPGTCVCACVGVAVWFAGERANWVMQWVSRSSILLGWRRVALPDISACLALWDILTG